jgi:hypothetical protein
LVLSVKAFGSAADDPAADSIIPARTEHTASRRYSMSIGTLLEGIEFKSRRLRRNFFGRGAYFCKYRAKLEVPALRMGDVLTGAAGTYNNRERNFEEIAGRRSRGESAGRRLQGKSADSSRSTPIERRGQGEHGRVRPGFRLRRF